MTTRTTSIRMDEELATDAEAVARVEGVSLNEVVRQALAEHIAAKRADKVFQAALTKAMKTNQALLERLAKR
ncbi:MAG: ribbon-helix-helix protein, CopG family [Acidimicrobiales bacterium]